MKVQIKIIFLISMLVTFSCEDFVEVETPNFQIVGEDVFSNDKTAIAAINGIYNELMRASFSRGGPRSISVLGDMSADIIKPIDITNTRYGPFWENEISTLDSPDADINLELWNSAYNIIYLTNNVLEGLGESRSITKNIKEHLMGQALFIRAFCYFYLTNLYSDIPLILTTDYNKNALVSRDPTEMVWNQITKDLEQASTFLQGLTFYTDEERTNVNLYVVKALQARVYLYLKDWRKAEELSSQVIEQSEMYDILNDLNQVFLANSKEAIWQISPSGQEGQRVTNEAQVFIRFVYIPGIVLGDLECTDSFIDSFNKKDKRFINWIGQEKNEEDEIIRYYSYKYKYRSSPNLDIPEYSMVMRLAEQYLIRAEARAMQNNLKGAIEDVDKLRQRSGIELIAKTNPTIGQKELITLTIEERKKELFTEWGHRWLDLKRKGNASNVLSPFKSLWQSTDIWYPIPGEERIRNSNLTQNLGY